MNKTIRLDSTVFLPGGVDWWRCFFSSPLEGQCHKGQPRPVFALGSRIKGELEAAHEAASTGCGRRIIVFFHKKSITFLQLQGFSCLLVLFLNDLPLYLLQCFSRLKNNNNNPFLEFPSSSYVNFLLPRISQEVFLSSAAWEVLKFLRPSRDFVWSKMVTRGLPESVPLGCGSYLSDVEIHLFVFILVQEPGHLAQGMFTEVFPVEQQAHCGAMGLNDGQGLQRQPRKSTSSAPFCFLYISQNARRCSASAPCPRQT